MDLTNFKYLALMGMTAALSASTSITANTDEEQMLYGSDISQEVTEQVIYRAEKCSTYCQGGQKVGKVKRHA